MTHKKAIIMYCIVSCFLFFEMALQVSPSVMSFQLMHDLNLSAFGLGLMSGCYFYSYTFMQIPSGILFDTFNPRLVITIPLVICAIGSLLLSVATTIYVGALARLLMGFGSAFAFISVLVVIADLFAAKHFAFMTGITQMLAALGAMSGQLPISKLIHVFGWRATLMGFAGVGLLLALVVFVLLRYEKVDRGCATHSSYRFADFKTIIVSPQTWFVALYACLLWAPMSGFASLWGVPFLIKVDHFSALHAAFLCSFMWLGLAAASPILGAISTAVQNRKMPLLVSAVIGAASFSVILFVKVDTMLMAFLLFMAGAACAGQALSFTVVRENNLAAVRSSAIALNNMAVVISGAVLQPLIGYLWHQAEQHAVVDYRYAISVVLVAYCVASVLALFFIKESLTEKFA